MKYDYRLNAYKALIDGELMWRVYYPELKGIEGVGKTYEEAVCEGEKQIERYYLLSSQKGEEIIKPKIISNDDFKGKILLRIPKALHQELLNISNDEKISVNNLINRILNKEIFRFKQA